MIKCLLSWRLPRYVNFATVIFSEEFHILFQQFLLGNDLQSCREALTSNAGDNLHLLERINIDLQVQNSIVPTAYSLARFKVSGTLPTLNVNLSDTKYKALMRLVDVCIPKFDDDQPDTPPPPPPPDRNASGAFQGLFGQKGTDYTLPLDDDEDDDHTSKSREEFFEADEGSIEVCIVC